MSEQANNNSIPLGYISSREASRTFRVTHDYIARLCRRGKVRGVLVGRNWFVDPKSLAAFLGRNKLRRPQVVTLGAEGNAIPLGYISSREASRIFHVTHDYIARLCRRGKVRGVLVGRNWFVDTESLAVLLGESKQRRIKAATELSRTSKPRPVINLASAYSLIADTPAHPPQPSPRIHHGAVAIAVAVLLIAGVATATVSNTIPLGASVAQIESPFFLSFGGVFSRFLSFFQKHDETELVVTPPILQSPPAEKPVSQTIVQNTYPTYPVVARTVERIVSAPQDPSVPPEAFVMILSEMNRSLRSEISRVVSGSLDHRSGGSDSGTVTLIDVSGGTTGLIVSGGPITTSGTLTLSGTVEIANGGTGTSSTPTYGQLLVGNASGGYDLLATSSLGITAGSIAWGSITGTLSAQTDLQSAFDAKLSLSDWYATTTDGLDEGTTNRYFTDERSDDRVAAFLQAGSGILLTYNDPANTLTISASGGGGGTDVNWTFFNGSGLYPATSTNQVVIGGTSTSTLTNPLAKLGVIGGASIDHATTTNFFATTASSTNLFTSNLSIASLTGLLKATAGVVSTAVAGVDYALPGDTAFKDWSIQNGALSPTTTLGIGVFASSTIGNGTQAGGLTISGGATTTGNAYFAGNVGIGTTTPWGLLAVEQGTESASFVVSNTGSSSPSLWVNGVNGNGRVGIGIANPTAALHVQSAQSNFNVLSFNNANNGFNLAGVFVDSSSNAWLRIYDAGNNEDIRLRANGDSYITGGNVGIGTTSPTSLLDLYADQPRITFFDNTAVLSSANPTWALRSQDTGFFRLQTTSDLVTYTDRLTVSSSGNVGIGTAAPASPLHIYGTSNGTRSIAIDSQGTGNLQQAGFDLLTLGNGTTTIGQPGTKGWQTMARGNAYTDTAQQNDFFIAHFDGSAWSNDFWIDSVTHNVGIGDTTPDFLLDVAGTLGVDGQATLSTILMTGGTITGRADNNFLITSDTDLFLDLDNDNDGAETFLIRDGADANVLTLTEAGTLTVTGAIVFPGEAGANANDFVCISTTGNLSPKATACTGSSALRYKENIEDLSLGLDAVLQMRPVAFDWTQEYIQNPDAPRQIGFIAEEMEQISPLFVTYENGQIEGVEYMKLTSVLAKAIQELNLNLETIASTTASSTPESESFAESFFANIFARMTTWLADAGNGIAELFARTIHAQEKICVDDQCLTREDVRELLEVVRGNAATPPPPAPTPDPEPSPDPEPTPTPDPGPSPEPTPEPDTEEEPQPKPAPQDEPESNPEPTAPVDQALDV